MLALRPNCEACNRDLAPDGCDAMICTFECTFCNDCAKDRFGLVCPNCGGNLVERPARPTRLLESYPGSTERVLKDHGAS